MTGEGFQVGDIETESVKMGGPVKMERSALGEIPPRKKRL